MSQHKSLSQQLISFLSPKPKEETVDHPVAEKTVYTKEEKKTLPFIVGHSLSSKELNLEGRALSVMVSEIGQLVQLTTLNLSNNRIPSLPPSIGNLKNLELFDVSNNSLVDLPKEIVNLTKLDTFMLNNNQFQRIPDDLWNLPLLTTLYLNDNKIQTLGKNVALLTQLISLNLKNNKLTKIPKEIILLQELKTLQLDGNDIQDAPLEILSLKLDIKGKLGALLRKEVVNFKFSCDTDDSLNLSARNLRALVFDTMDHAGDIKKLDLTSNQLCTLHPEIFMFPSLTTLILRKNTLLKVTGISKIASLTHLDISYNMLDEFPREIFEIGTITTLYIENNPFTHPLPQLALLLDEPSTTQWIAWDKRCKRRQVLEELLQTEQGYVGNIRKLCDYFAPIEKLNILSKDDLKFLYSPFQVILGVNENFLKSLTKLYNDHNMLDTFDLGALFVENGFSFKLYTVYINEYSNVYTKFKTEMEKNKKFKDYWSKIPEFANKSDPTKLISSYFILPIQRMPRYQLLLTELRRSTPLDHPGTESLAKGLKVIQEIADYCNLKKAEKEFMNRVGDIAQEINDPTLIKSSRLVLYELTNVKKIEEKSQKKAKIYLFNDLFLIIEADRVSKFENHFMAMEKLKDFNNRVRISSNGYDGIFELENGTTIDELIQLWFEEAQRFWQPFLAQMTTTESSGTVAMTRVKSITNKRMSLKASSLSTLTTFVKSGDKIESPAISEPISVSQSPNFEPILLGEKSLSQNSFITINLNGVLTSSGTSKKLSKLKGLSTDKGESGEISSDLMTPNITPEITPREFQ
jgi:Leucine-rich repeat (LRR) protein